MFKLKNIKILAFYIHAPVPKMLLSYLQVSKSNDKPFLNRVYDLRTTKPGPLFMVKKYCSRIKICATIPVVMLRDGT